ncbi:(2Fe-2S)-binding protein [Cognatazoarcus halotolerans]|uniref:(2Fe-2S)-binding protein n=1 Tax=Cognatazoarcus halotolerans TaxID=2686016 RepID=UPI0013593C6A|nr:(2Fe-2S)-binding protein [Cognatazoarcus halotolerans]MBX3679052.1 (2Fe-2S)-binding protein [Rhodocyclaceae bacterium]MCB1901447.1 (2Fe-2S)-binding protein [Rhodocyclaceae bacterium]MCP5308171.1 (2Fe-2S)-binding protein [Zoogloeaceae bacterium]
MYVCVCNAVTDTHIREAASAGAKTLLDLRRTLGVASECGRCASCARDCLKQVHACELPQPGAQLRNHFVLREAAA